MDDRRDQEALEFPPVSLASPGLEARRFGGPCVLEPAAGGSYLFWGFRIGCFLPMLCLLKLSPSMTQAFLESHSGNGRGLSCNSPEWGDCVCALELFWDSCGFQETFEGMASFTSSVVGRGSVLDSLQDEGFTPGQHSEEG